ncbi:unnamed protein product, partial [Lymnaea stagnalis]
STRGNITLRKPLDFETKTNYTLDVVARERGGEYSSNVTITIFINDTNDEIPVCNPNYIVRTVKENELVNYTIVTLTCTDRDLGSILSYTLTKGNSTLFKVIFIFVNFSSLKLNAPLDYERATFHDLTVTVSDGVSSHDVPVSVVVNVADVDEGPPVFESGLYQVNISEAINISAVILKVKANDPDSPLSENGIVRYLFANTNRQFFIDSNTGNISVLESLDRETVPMYNLTVRASDASNFTSTTVIINVLDVNDNAPVFTSSSYRGNISEITQVGTSILTVTASDKDDPNTNNYGKVFYAIVGGSSNFSINSTTGVIQNLRILDADSLGITMYTLIVSATGKVIKVVEDNKQPIHNTTVTINLKITDINDNDPFPVFNPAVYSAAVSEDVAVGFSLASVTATDGDISPAFRNVTYAIIDGNTGGKFSINNSGALTVSSALDYETTTNYSLVIQASDGVHYANVSYSILVKPVNEFTPVFNPGNVTLPIPENTVFGSNVTVSVSMGCNNSNIMFQITNGNNGSKFSIDHVKGTIMLVANLDYETKNIYYLEITASDQGFPPMTSSGTVTVGILDVNEYAPVFVPASPYNVSVKENLNINSVLIKVNASDGDIFDSTKMFSIFAGNGAEKFLIDPVTGSIRLLNSLDYEQQKYYNLTLRVADSGNLLGTVTLNIFVEDVNDNRPVCNDTFVAVIVDENVTAGDLFTPLSATDEDKGFLQGTVRYYIVAGDPDVTFDVDEFSGEIKTTKPLDRETVSNYTLTVSAVDDMPGSSNQKTNVMIKVNDVNDNPPMCISIINIDRREGMTNITTLTCTDRDKNTVLSYSVARFYYKITGPFGIDPLTGQVSVISNIDRETNQAYTLLIRATDKGMPARTGTLTLSNLNDNAPYIIPIPPVNIKEDQPIGRFVVKVNASDNDADLNAQLVYNISSGNSANKFNIDSVDGTIVLQGSLDYETTKLYELVVTVTDKGLPPLSTSATVTVSVSDINDNSPVCNESLYVSNIPENAKDILVTKVFDINATDADLSDNIKIFSIISGNTSVKFTIDSSTGIIRILSSLDYEQQQSYALTLLVQDSTALNSTTIISITVLDVNDNSPVCKDTSVVVSVDENKSTG